MIVEEMSAVKAKPFYQLGGNLPADAPSYVRRAADDELLTHLQAGLFCYVLTSRQMGKSSLMVQTARKLREAGTKVAVLDLQRIGQNLTPAQWYDGLLIPLGREFRLENQLDDFWNSTDPAIAKMGPMQRWMTAIREVILRSVKSRIVIFVDEIDAVRGLPFPTDEFFAGIRQMYNERTLDPELERITFCLQGVATPSDLIRNVNTTPFNIGRRIELTDFTEEEAQPLLAGLGRDLRVGRKLLARVLWWTGGHPYLTQRLCARIAEDATVVSQSDVDRICTEAFLSSRSREKDDNLLFVRERLLRSDVDRASLLDLYSHIREGKKVPDDDSNTLVDTLRLAGVTTVSSTRLAVRNRIYAHVFDKKWIRLNMPDAELRRQKRAFYKGVGIAAAGAAVVLGGWAVVALWTLYQQDRFEDRTYANNMVQAQQAFDAGDFGSGTTLLKQWMVENETTWGRSGFEWKWLWGRGARSGFEWNWLWARYSGESATTYYGHWDEVRSVAISPLPSSGLVVTAGADSTVRIFDRNVPCSAGSSAAAPGVPIEPGPQTSIPCVQLVRAIVVSKGGLRSYLPGDKEWLRLSGACAFPPSSSCPPPGVQPSVMSVAFSPDGAWVAIATGYWRSLQTPGHVYLYRTADGKIFPVPTHYGVAITAVALSGRNELATAGMDDTAEFFRIKPDGTVSEDRQPFDPGSAVSGGMNAVAFSPGGRYCAMAFEDGRLAVKDMDAPDTAVIRTPVLDVSGLVSLTFYNDDIILVGSKDGDIGQVNSSTLEATGVVASGQGLVSSLAVSKDLLVSTGSDSTVRVWRLKQPNGKLVEAANPSTLRGHRAKVYAAAITPDQQWIVSGSADKGVRFWIRQPNNNSGDTSQSDDTPSYASQSQSFGVHGVVSALAFSPVDGSQIVYLRGVPGHDTAPGPDGYQTEVFFYDFAKRALQTRWAHHGFGTAVAYSSDGSYVATGDNRGSVALWDTRRVWADPAYTPRELPVRDAKAPIIGLAFSSDGTLAASNGSSISLWKPGSNGSTGTEAYAPVPLAQTISKSRGHGALAFSPDGKWLAVCTSDASNYTVDILNAGDPTPDDPSQVLEGDETPDQTGKFVGPCSALAFSSNSNWLAAGTVAREIAVWNVRGKWWSVKGKWRRVTGEAYKIRRDRQIVQTPLPAPPQTAAFINAVTFSPDNRIVAYSTTDSKIFLWNLDDKQPRPPVNVHLGGVSSIAFSPNGKCLASGSTDGTLRITPTAAPELNVRSWMPFGTYWWSCIGRAP